MAIRVRHVSRSTASPLCDLTWARQTYTAVLSTVYGLSGWDRRTYRALAIDHETSYPKITSIDLMQSNKLENASPVVYATKSRNRIISDSEFDPNVVDPIDAQEIFDYIRDINDPEHPLTLEQLNVVQEELISVREDDDGETTVDVMYTPTIPHCSMATLIGLTIRVKLQRSLHPSVKTVVRITPGSHTSADAISKQLADKERVAAALENPALMEVVNQCLTPRDL